MDKYKTYEELKEELGDKFEYYMYEANIELMNNIDKAIDYIWSTKHEYGDLEEDNENFDIDVYKLISILRGD